MLAQPVHRVSLLDGFSLHLTDRGSDDSAVELPHGVQRLVAHVYLYRRRPRTLVAGRLWPDVPEDLAHGSLRSTLWRLQRTVPGLVCTVGDCLALADGVRVDVDEVDAWARRTRDDAVALEDILVPEGVVHGDLLPGWYDDWVLLERERVRQVLLHTLEVAADRLATAGRLAEALEAAYAAVRTEPLRESAHRTLVRVHLADGNILEARRAYEHFRDLLADELGVAPTEKMTALVARVPLPRRPGTAAPRLSGGRPTPTAHIG